MKYCLIGKTLKHSYSKLIHESFGEYKYDLVELLEEDVESWVKNREYNYYNVTIPYKEKVMPYLDYIEPFAMQIGAVNTVVNKNGKLYGYNTDFFGMEYMLEKADISLKDKTLLILGSGGTSKTAMAVAKAKGAKKAYVVSRNGAINYDNCYEIDANVIINTTPVGMFPNQNEMPINISRFKNLEGVADAIYNPLKTLLCYEAERLGVKAVNGLYMLVAQAKKARDIFMDTVTDNSIIDITVRKIEKQTENIVLTGMSGVGKSTIGKLLSKMLDKVFIDTDNEIVSRVGKSITEIFAEHGEEYFRKIESEVVREVSLLRGAVISTGGGVVTVKDNQIPLKLNGKAVWIKRDISKVCTKGRPLVTDLEKAKRLYNERIPVYTNFSDFSVENNGKIEDVVKEIMVKCGY